MLLYLESPEAAGCLPKSSLVCFLCFGLTLVSFLSNICSFPDRRFVCSVDVSLKDLRFPEALSLRLIGGSEGPPLFLSPYTSSSAERGPGFHLLVIQ